MKIEHLIVLLRSFETFLAKWCFHFFFFFLIYNSKVNTKEGETEIIHKIELKN